MRLALALALLLVPAGLAQVGTVAPEQVETTLYLHPLNIQDMAINTQQPDVAQVGDQRWGPIATSGGCIQQAAGDPDGTGGDD